MKSESPRDARRSLSPWSASDRSRFPAALLGCGLLASISGCSGDGMESAGGMGTGEGLGEVAPASQFEDHDADGASGVGLGGAGATAPAAAGSIALEVTPSKPLVSDGEARSGDVSKLEQAIVNGSTDFSGKEWMRDRTAWVNNADGGGCSGTFLDPQTVITARHCVTSNGERGGSKVSASKMTVGNWQTPGRTVERLDDLDDKHDVALLLLDYADRVTDSLGEPIASTIEPKNPSSYKDDNIYISGWGNSQNNGNGTSALRWGRMTVQDDYVADFRGGSKHGIKLKQTSADQRGAPGDSGGPYWGEKTAPRGIIGVHAGDTFGLDPREVGTQAYDIRDWALGEIDKHHGLESGAGVSMYFDSGSEVAKAVVIAYGSTPAWFLGGSELRQTENAGRSLVIWRELVTRDFDLRVYMSSPDNDTAGVVFHYADRDNYSSCSVNDEENWIRLREVKNGSETTIAEASWSGSLTTSKRMVVTGDSAENAYTCGFDGIEISGNHYQSPVGAMGVLQANNEGVSFQNFVYKGSRYEL